MKAWWEGLDAREQRILLLGAGFLLVAGLYLFAWDPVYKKHTRLSEQVTEQRALLHWMQERALEAKQLQGNTPAKSKVQRKGSLLSLIDSSARKAGMGSFLRRVEPTGTRKVRVWFEDVAFDRLITWLGTLVEDYDIQLDTIVVDRQDQAGQVNARLVISDAGTHQAP